MTLASFTNVLIGCLALNEEYSGTQPCACDGREVIFQVRRGKSSLMSFCQRGPAGPVLKQHRFVQHRCVITLLKCHGDLTRAHVEEPVGKLLLPYVT